jgi:hypothetical protein
MKKIKKAMVCLVLAGVAFPFIILSLTGCGGETEEVTSEDISGSTGEENTATESDATEITPGSFDGDTYINESFDFKLSLAANDEWSFKTTEEIADGTGEKLSDIEGVLSGEISPYSQSISYLAIACNEETGSNIIINYMCPAVNGLDTYMTAEEYLTKAAESYDDAKTGKANLAGSEWDYLERTDLSDANQRIYAKSSNGIIVMITFTVTDDEDCVSMFK